MNFSVKKTVLFLFGSFAAVSAMKVYAQPAFEVNGKAYQVSDVEKRDQSAFYDVEKKKYDLIDQHAQSLYMELFWEKMAKEKGGTAAEAQKKYLKEQVKVSKKDIDETLNRFKDHPQLSKLPPEEQKKQVEDYLRDRGERDVLQGLISKAIAKGDIKVLYPQPNEPVFDIKVSADEPVKYGPNDADIKPMGCEGDKCAITVVEYSEFQCPFCAKVLPDVKRLMTEYKGKIRWIVRDFPLSFHNRAKPAAVAAHCAHKQGKYWEMYSKLFENQRALEDADLAKYAKEIKLNEGDFGKCIKNAKEIEAKIDANMESGAKVGVSGTPAFFINGKRLSGAVPYEDFKRIMEVEVKKKG